MDHCVFNIMLISDCRLLLIFVMDNGGDDFFKFIDYYDFFYQILLELLRATLPCYGLLDLKQSINQSIRQHFLSIDPISICCKRANKGN